MGDTGSATFLSAGVSLTKCITWTPSRTRSERGRCVKMWFEITGLVTPPTPPLKKKSPASIKMIACVCYASTDGPRTDMLHVHKVPPGFLCGYRKRRLCCFILKQYTQVVEPQFNVLNVIDVVVLKSLIKSYGTASSLSARTRAVGGGRERGGSGGGALSVSG